MFNASFSFGYAGFFFVNLIQTRVPKKGGPKLRIASIRGACEPVCEGVFLVNDGGRARSTVDGVTHGCVILGHISEQVRVSKPLSRFSPRCLP